MAGNEKDNLTVRNPSKKIISQEENHRKTTTQEDNLAGNNWHWAWHSSAPACFQFYSISWSEALPNSFEL